MRAVRRCERAFVILGVCLPIPLFAATGLSVPLPATVERIAAALVPWADEAPLDDAQSFSLGENGSIVLAPGEVPTVLPHDQRMTSAAADPGLQLAGNESKPPDQHSKSPATETGGGKPTPTSDGGEPLTTPSGGGGGSQDPSNPATGPIQGAAGGVIDATEPVVGAVEGSVGDTGTGGIVEGAGGAVEETAETVDGIVTGIGG
jgi:hypothetical protein